MRDIKFRAWDGVTMHEDVLVYSENSVIVEGDSFHLEDNIISVKNIMQYTGLKDKNGVEIYEGDILTTEIDFGYGSQSVVAMVIWKGAGWQFDSEAGCAYGNDGCFKVIGNIYDNPELLEA